MLYNKYKKYYKLRHKKGGSRILNDFKNTFLKILGFTTFILSYIFNHETYINISLNIYYIVNL
jgi:hypothetical protein